MNPLTDKEIERIRQRLTPKYALDDPAYTTPELEALHNLKERLAAAERVVQAVLICDNSDEGHRPTGPRDEARAWCFQCQTWCYPRESGKCEGCEAREYLSTYNQPTEPHEERP